MALRCPAQCHHYAEVGVRSDIGPAREAANTAPGGGLQGMQGPGAMPPPPPMPGMQGLGPGQHGPERAKNRRRGFRIRAQSNV